MVYVPRASHPERTAWIHRLCVISLGAGVAQRLFESVPNLRHIRFDALTTRYHHCEGSTLRLIIIIHQITDHTMNFSLVDISRGEISTQGHVGTGEVVIVSYVQSPYRLILPPIWQLIVVNTVVEYRKAVSSIEELISVPQL